MGMGCDLCWEGEGGRPARCVAAAVPPYPKILTVSSAVDLSGSNRPRGVCLVNGDEPPSGTLKSRRDRENVPQTEDTYNKFIDFLSKSK